MAGEPGSLAPRSAKPTQKDRMSCAAQHTIHTKALVKSLEIVGLSQNGWLCYKYAVKHEGFGKCWLCLFGFVIDSSPTVEQRPLDI